MMAAWAAMQYSNENENKKDLEAAKDRDWETIYIYQKHLTSVF